MIESDHHPSLHVDFGKFLPKLASYVNYLFAALPLPRTQLDSDVSDVSDALFRHTLRIAFTLVQWQ